ncbi:MAG: DUF4376 domain-containing protein [Magnetospirillum sp.]|nr:DUF4376 domain-containing protein [Magnetospirillum sp.]
MTYVDQYYEDADGGVHFLSAQDQANAAARGLPLPAPSWTVIAAAQAQAILNPPPTLAEAQAQQVGALQAAYAAASEQPVSYTTKGGVAKTFQADPASVANLQAALAGCVAAQATPSGFYWVAEDNTQVPFAYADLQGLAAAMFAQGAAAFQHLQTRKAAVTAATTVAAVQAVTW